MEQGMRQSMVATAAMQMFMRTLQATNMELSQMAAQAIAANPALEELPPTPGDRDQSEGGQADGEGLHETANSDAGDRDGGSSALDYDATRRHDYVLESLTEPVTLADHLAGQIHASAPEAALEALSLQLIDQLDRRGYFTESAEALREELGAPRELFAQALALIRDLEPAGVGAFDLRDSLMLQLQHADEADGLSMQLLRNHWDELVRHRYADIARACGESKEAVSAAARRIARLNPDPGSAFSRAEEHVIAPDLIVTLDEGKPVVRLTGEGIPRLGLSADYRAMLTDRADETELRRYLSRCFREGRELIKAISDRQQTILTVARAIVARQEDFFREGPAALKPLRMEDIAQDTGLHVSTVSRAVKGKYLRCDHGVYELRRFFTAALPSAASEGGLSADAVRSRIRELIEAEDPRHPLSDARIEAELSRIGISVARRTIAKYREQLNILPASMRRRR